MSKLRKKMFSHKGQSKVYIIAAAVILVLVAFVVYKFVIQKNTSGNLQTGLLNSGAKWKEVGPVIKGEYADAEIVDLGGGKFRMYYSVEPEVKGNKLELYSSTSNDGINWTKDAGTRKEFATFPDVVKLSDGSFRLYYQNMGIIKSAKSTDGLIWNDEPGTRVSKNETGYNLDRVGAQTTTQLADGSYIMVYTGTENKPYSNEKLPNQTTSYLFYAVSSDGINFTKKGLAVDSRDDTLKGFIDGEEWVKWDDGGLRLYFWSYKGIFHLDYQGGKFSKPELDFSKDPNLQFSPNPPSDPTLAKINGKWFMFYGQHTKGIYYATQQ